MNNLIEMRKQIDSYSKLEDGWDGYGSDRISKTSITVAKYILETIYANWDSTDKRISIFPMPNGGIQLDIGDLIELEIYDFNVKELVWNEEYSLIKKETKNYSKIIREKKLRRIIGE